MRYEFSFCMLLWPACHIPFWLSASRVWFHPPIKWMLFMCTHSMHPAFHKLHCTGNEVSECKDLFGEPEMQKIELHWFHQVHTPCNFRWPHYCHVQQLFNTINLLIKDFSLDWQTDGTDLHMRVRVTYGMTWQSAYIGYLAAQDWIQNCTASCILISNKGRCLSPIKTCLSPYQNCLDCLISWAVLGVDFSCNMLRPYLSSSWN